MSGDSIDNRIVEMTFNNADFERKLAETMKSLDRLKQTLDFSASRRSVDDLSSAASRFNLGHMGDSVQTVSGKFLALSTIAVTTLATITSAAIKAGANVLKAFTLDPVLDGYREYETNINSIQTILANTSSKGTTLEDVTRALDILNQYSDQTIYNFSEMTRNIGTFTAAGVDLDTSVNAIKGIANLAAISGSNSQQASTAMYQLSQALATGTVKLMDWNSVVNAGMGGEVFQKALFETGKALGTIADVPIGQTFDEWKAAGNSFRASLESGWVTSDVLTTTLSAFTGDLTQAQLVALGYTEQQASEMLKLGQIGKAAATEVKTLTQLLGTVKEAVGSGWAQSFRIIFGDFEEAKTLFTGISNTINGMVSRSAESRNSLLQGWKDLGGRDSLIAGITNAFKALFAIIKPIRQAFENIFPPATAETLFKLTERFRKFTEGLIIGVGTVRKIRTIFEGIFSALKIGWEVFKQGVKVVRNLFSSFAEANGSRILDFFVAMANKVKEFKREFVDTGKIADFFMRLENAIRHPIEFIKNLRDAILDFFKGKGIDTDKVTGPLDRLQSRFEGLKTLAGKMGDIWAWIKNAAEPITSALNAAWDSIQAWFADLGQRLADGMDAEDFDPVFDALNTLLLGGIAGTLAMFLKNGFKFDLGDGLFENISGAFDQLTSTLTTMQTEIKANALLKIAGAIALLTASVLILSTIDSKALTKALTAMTVGFGQLIGSMQLLAGANKNLTGAAALSVMTGGLIAMAGAILTLSGAMAVVATLDWEGIAKGMLAFTILLGGLVAAARLLQQVGPSLIGAGLGMAAIGVALLILAGAVKAFGSIDMGELAKGLGAVAVMLAALTFAVLAMPTVSLIPMGIGLLGVATAMVILAGAVKLFAGMNWVEMGKGMAGLAGGLLILVLALNAMPSVALIPMGVGLLGVALALNLIALALQQFAGMSWGDIGKGLATLAGSLLILTLALNAMAGAVPGAIALGIAASGLFLMTKVLKGFAELKVGDIVKGLLAMAGVFLVLGLGAAALSALIVPMLGLGAALIMLGAGFALIGVGAIAFAKAMEIIAKVGAAGIKGLIKGIAEFVKAIPGFADDLAKGVAAFLTTFLEALPPLIEALAIVLVKILDTVIQLTPKFVEAAIALIEGFLVAVNETAPELIATGLNLLLTFLQGVRDNIGEITKVAIEIVSGFLQALTEEIPTIVTDVVNLFVAFIESVAYNLGLIAVTLLVGVGRQFITGFIDGIEQEAPGITSFFTKLPGKILGWIGDVARTLWDKGWSIISGLFKGIVERIEGVKNWFLDLPEKILDWIGDAGQWLIEVGKRVIEGLIQGIKDMVASLLDTVKGIAGDVIGAFTFGFGIFSPSRETAYLGKMLMLGLSKGMNESSRTAEITAGEAADSVMSAFRKSLDEVQVPLGALDDIQPTITPVLDLTQVEREASQFGKMMTSPVITPTVTFESAKLVSAETRVVAEENATPATTNEPKTTEIHFEQNNYSPEPLNQAALYRRTRSQIELAKKELAVT